MCTDNAILCTRSRLISVCLEFVFGKRFRLERVCKVCTQLGLLLQFYKGSCSEATFATFGSLSEFFVVLDAVLPRAGREICKLLYDYRWRVRKSGEIFSDYCWLVKKLREILENYNSWAHAASRGPVWPPVAPRGIGPTYVNIWSVEHRVCCK